MKTFISNKMSGLTKALCVASFLLMSLAGWSQLQSKADLSITSITIADDIPKRGGGTIDAKTTFANLKCTITMHNANTSQLMVAKLAIVLPAGITLVKSPENSTLYVSGTGNRGGWPGSFLVDLVFVGGEDDKTVEFTFSRSSSGNSVSAYVFSGCPDPNPANNSNSGTY